MALKARPDLKARFKRRGVVLQPDAEPIESLGVLNPASARLRDGSLQLYPRMVAEGNISRIGSFHGEEQPNGDFKLTQRGFALEPEADYELRDGPGGHGCEDPRVTFVPVLDCYLMAYVALGPRAPEVAFAFSHDGLKWERLGLANFRESDEPFADKDAAFFPEPVRSPDGVESLAFYHRPTLERSLHPENWPAHVLDLSCEKGEEIGAFRVPLSRLRERMARLLRIPPGEREEIAIGYIPLSEVRKDIGNLCTVRETHRLELPEAPWGRIKVGGGTPPVRIREGWMALIHGIDPLEKPVNSTIARYVAGIIIHDPAEIARVIYRSPEPILVPEIEGEIQGIVNDVVFPTAIDPRPDVGERVFDVFYGMADYEIGCGSLTLE